MKRLIRFLLILSILVISCKKEINYNNVACGIENPTENINWIKDIVSIAETDTTGNYFGSIYLEEFQGYDVIFIKMMMGSGGVYGYWYNCDGTKMVFEDTIIFPKMDNLIYTNIGF
ncbi:hypothetical protein ACFLT1_01765 [Bacteroidota bacterium]